MVSKSDAAAKSPSKPANAVDAQTTVEASQSSERSWLSGLWASGIFFISCFTLVHLCDRCVTGTELFSHADATIQDKPNTEEESFTATDTSDR